MSVRGELAFFSWDTSFACQGLHTNESIGSGGMGFSWSREPQVFQHTHAKSWAFEPKARERGSHLVEEHCNLEG